jgi:hypothetical protein
MADMPPVRPQAPAEPLPADAPAAGTRPRLTAIDLLAFACELFALVTLALWGFTAWPLPWNIVAGIGAPLLAILVWALFVSPRAVVRVHPFVRALVELLIYVSATIAWWSMGYAVIGIVFGLIAVTVGVVAGRRRFA